jgi:hypothetical protein
MLVPPPKEKRKRHRKNNARVNMKAQTPPNNQSNPE